ncbi:vitamin B12 independent methionine synthase [Oenococcus alcoholitolerans]|uniref:vitamin B12 independent methionine synthase n=1 Tax=Oenococcus alcoholitolerans TaxID=931074 RepID=UPI003F713247
MTDTNTLTKVPFRADLVGSLLRPQELKDAHKQLEEGKIDQAAYLAIQRKQIKRIAAKQAELGFKDVTDGEFSRSWWHLDFLWGLGGVDKYDYKKSYKFHGSKTRTDNAELVGKIAYNPQHPFFEAFKYLKSVAPASVLPKQTIPSPSLLFRDNRSDNWNRFYQSWNDYLEDIVKTYRQTILHFYELGARYVQLDDTTWAFLISRLNDTKDQADQHAEYEKLAQDSVDVINGILKDLPDDLTVTTHICRGNFKSTYLFSGSYDVIAPYLSQLNYDGLFLEYDNQRSGGFEPLKKIWNGDENKRIVLGLVTSKIPDLEQEAFLKTRIEEAAEYVPLDNLAISTQCGFASTEEGNKLTEDQQWDKLRLVVQTASDVWGQI